MNIDALINHPEWLLLVLAPLFVVCMLAEYFIGQKQGRLPDNSSYKLSEVMCNFTLAGMHQLSDLLTGLLVVQLYIWMFGWRLMDIEMGVLIFLVLGIIKKIKLNNKLKCFRNIILTYISSIINKKFIIDLNCLCYFIST